MMKRIVCLIDSLGPGGAQRQFVGLASLLADKNYEVMVITYHNDPFFKPMLEEKHITIKELEEGVNGLKRILGVRKLIKEYCAECVIAYQETPSIIACLVRLSGVNFKLIVSERSTTQVKTLKDKIRFALYRKAKYIVPNSYSQSDYLREGYTWMTPKIRTITNFVDTNYFSPSLSPRQESCCLQLVTASSVSINKNILAFIDAVGKVVQKGYHGFSIKWFGEVETSKALCQECRERISKNKLSGIFEILPKTNDIVSEYRKADVFFLPTLYEGTPNALCEAMSCGLLILCSAVCDIPRYVQEGGNGVLFDPKSVNSMADAIIKVLDMPVEKIREFGKVSREMALDKFSKDKFINEYIKLIEG